MGRPWKYPPEFRTEVGENVGTSPGPDRSEPEDLRQDHWVQADRDARTHGDDPDGLPRPRSSTTVSATKPDSNTGPRRVRPGRGLMDQCSTARNPMSAAGNRRHRPRQDLTLGMNVSRASSAHRPAARHQADTPDRQTPN